MSHEEYVAQLLTLLVGEVQKALIHFYETYVKSLEKEFDELQGENERLKRRMRVLEQNLSKGYKTSKRISELEEEVKRYRDMATKLRRDKVKLQDTIQRLRSEAQMNESRPIQILELFGGIGSPRVALRNIGVPVKAIDYVEIDEKAVRSYNAIFESELAYQTQTVVGYNLKPDILIHGSPCQDFSIAGYQKGADEGSGTRSSLMWETINIIKQMGEWRPKYVIWENVKNVRSKYMVRHHDKYISEMQKMGYVSTFEILDARDFGIPQARQRVFTISVLNGDPFDFADLIKTPMKDINDFLKTNVTDEKYIVTQPSMIKKIENKDSKGFKVNIIENFAYTITCKQMRSPNSGVIALPDGRYRYLTERECWRLQGYSEEDFENALAANPSKPNKMNGALYKQAGNSIPVPIFESIFKKIIFGETADHIEGQSTIYDFLGELK